MPARLNPRARGVPFVVSVVEPVFANIGTNKGLKRFGLRSQQKVQGQWRLYCVVHNIEKLKNYGELARGMGSG